MCVGWRRGRGVSEKKKTKVFDKVRKISVDSNYLNVFFFPVPVIFMKKTLLTVGRCGTPLKDSMLFPFSGPHFSSHKTHLHKTQLHNLKI